MVFCKSCGVVLARNLDEGVDEHPKGSVCIEAVPEAKRVERTRALLDAIRDRGERFVVTWGQWRSGEQRERTLLAVKDGRYYGLDYTCRGLVKPNHAYMGVLVETGVGPVPVVVAEEEGKEAFFVALDPRSAVQVGDVDVLRERFASQLAGSPLVFEVREDRLNPGCLVAVLVEGGVTRVHKNGRVTQSKGPFAVDVAQAGLVRAGDRFVGVAGNARFTHVVLDLDAPERVDALLGLGREALRRRVAAWDAARERVVEQASARLASRAAEA